ncbi:hypothetical protein SEA_ARCADIA_2 [Arthrobacter phage Arcadia]|uniref:Uncharacterized protein n=1 Tax=Arthrobacter phage Arcadia TaxID=2024274 RepID=A0A222Z831_9CAUD|nr:hypothetical protein PQB74_gp02 [Arthrobacter phage Arcadia]ASR79966.1 hypothetical protein SEA_ARCADIA_2 [Arthrobacter phage Arcadia]ASR80159.1 hypothetical protein SEA_ELSA_2 [Arthrobacter phage Elsa]ASR80356.1 hypothetical protein SEA_NASON_2 [Arthrobacter phage Nason]
MPREQINYPNVAACIIHSNGDELEYEQGSPVPEGSEVFCDPALNVNWQTSSNDLDGHVQVSLTLPAGFLKARAKSLVEDVIDTSLYTPILTRQEINKLIRTLRIARDKAYGRDE